MLCRFSVSVALVSCSRFSHKCSFKLIFVPFLSFSIDFPFKIVCSYVSPPLTPNFLEKVVLSACGAESAACNMIESKQPPPSLPGGGGGGEDCWYLGGRLRGGGRTSPHSLLTIHKHILLSSYTNSRTFLHSLNSLSLQT